MNIEDRLALVREVGEEIVTEDELRALLLAKPHPVCYDGFEPSGRIHIAQGILRAINVNKMAKAGCTFKMFVADWHAWANNKMGGDLEKIQTVGKYFVEIWRAAGMDLDHVKFVWASEFVTDEAYWKKVMNIARDSSLDRILRTTQIMGRSDKDKLSASQILYPCMQAADIFHLEADITQLGMDQRKVNMLAREVGPKLGFYKPLVVSHHMLMGLQAPPTGLPQTRKGLEEMRIAETRMRISRFGESSDEIYTRTMSETLGEDRMRVIKHLAETSYPPSDDLNWVARLDERLAAAQHSNEAATLLRQAEERVVRAVAKETSLAREMGGSQIEARASANELAALRDLLAAEAKTLEGIGQEWEQAFIERATAMKMSKSNPDSAIFMTDGVADVERKMKNAFCPQKQVEENPVLEYFRYIIFQRHWLDPKTANLGETAITIERPEKFGGNSTYPTYAALAADFAEGKVHPMDLKKAAARYVNEILQPTREHFETHEEAKRLKGLVDSWQVTR